MADSQPVLTCALVPVCPDSDSRANPKSRSILPDRSISIQNWWFHFLAPPRGLGSVQLNLSSERMCLPLNQNTITSYINPIGTSCLSDACMAPEPRYPVFLYFGALRTLRVSSGARKHTKLAQEIFLDPKSM